jgi:heme/copper-type cytochrome/quinol oxidase subunit 2
MKNIMKNRLALSTVVTTLIILVVSVLLAGVVTYFAINVTSTRVQEESLSVSNQHLWVSGADGTAVGAMTVTNTGGRDVVLSKITVRGQASAWANVYTNTTGPLTANDITYTVASAQTGLTAASKDLVLPAGATMGIVITAPDSIGLNDIGITVAFTVFTSQAMYYKETNIQAAPSA